MSGPRGLDDFFNSGQRFAAIIITLISVFLMLLYMGSPEKITRTFSTFIIVILAALRPTSLLGGVITAVLMIVGTFVKAESSGGLARLLFLLGFSWAVGTMFSIWLFGL